ncbi:MAG: acetyl-CoA carboxylase, biotin carboxylase subunit [Candidatus Binatota bacterium]|nr:acetyl-CoA carboxylase, biotin carboxylase subunit [Candidatus Binatota bacterium]
MFRKILIANRGEIAVRVIRACRELGVGTVAVYSEADREALHVRMADEAYLVGPPPSRESYLVAERLIDTAKRAGAEAIHPGYGFLSERSHFAKACGEAGIVFIGPSPDAIDAMGDKVEARKRMTAAKVPVVPGSPGTLETEEAIVATALEIGFPVMLKAAAGGGGKGMRLVSNEGEIRAAARAARSEAKSSFGDDRIYVERFVDSPRHVEVQVLGDTHGEIVHVYERECSIQRRHQKVVEESPSPAIDAETREAMGRVAVQAAKAVDYVGAGTIEFLVDSKRNFYFLEMNTRIQVEHPITEMVTGVDLVKTQIEVAAGARLPFRQDDIRQRGWAIECRVYAEDPENNFMPAPGRIHRLREPGGLGIRNDSGVYEGFEVSIHYDPMISKLVSWAPKRDEAIARMDRALGEYVVHGPTTNIEFLRWILRHPRFQAGDFDTRFIQQEFHGLPPAEEGLERLALAAAAIAADGGGRRESAAAAPAATGNTWRIAARRDALRS